jgi:pimeloyl-ACP methyl ester carboxylesterase
VQERAVGLHAPLQDAGTIQVEEAVDEHLADRVEALLEGPVAADRSQYFRDLSAPFYGANRPGAKVSQAVRDAFWLMSMQGSLKAELDCIKAFSETDFTEDLKKFDVPTLIIHGDDDQIVPIAGSAMLATKLVRKSVLKVYAGGSHSLGDTDKDKYLAIGESDRMTMKFVKPAAAAVPAEEAPAPNGG